jgi:N-acetylglucosaminyl-diphospho-decaprenol L-rhamnosyltransferase
MISVVVVTHNSQGCVGPCIDAVARWLPSAERIVIDNASTDDSRAVASRHGATVVELSENVGFGRACNVGVSRAREEHVLFLNPDVTIAAVDARKLADLLEVAPLGLVVPSSTSRFTFAERSWMREAASLTLGGLRPRELPVRDPRRGGRAEWASGAALLVRVSEFLEVGTFDARYFMYFEDRDLSRRYRRAGLPVRTTAAVIAGHSLGGSSEIGDRRSELLAYSLMGWLQYTHGAYGPAVAIRASRLARRMHTALDRSVGLAARFVPWTRLRRKALQLEEMSQELARISQQSGRLERSDECEYWPDAITLIESWPGVVQPTG